MDIFHVKENVKSYAYPILKMIVCVGLIILFINRDCIVHIDNKAIDIIVGILCTTIGIVCIYCIYISVAELLLVYENRVKETAVSDRIIAKSKPYTIDEIVHMAEANDIIEIQIVSKNSVVEIGSSSDCESGSSKFFDKQYYIEDKTFEDIKDFKSELSIYAMNGQISVASIDGIAPKR